MMRQTKETNNKGNSTPMGEGKGEGGGKPSVTTSKQKVPTIKLKQTTIQASLKNQQEGANKSNKNKGAKQPGLGMNKMSIDIRVGAKKVSHVRQIKIMELFLPTAPRNGITETGEMPGVT